MYSSDQEAARRKKPRGYEIASYILIGGGTINLVMGFVVLLFMSRFFGRLGAPLGVPIWYFSMLLSQFILGLIMVIVGFSLYRYAQE